MAPAPWGVTTQRDGKIYVHILDWHAPQLAIAPIAKITAAHTLVGSAPVTFTQSADGVVLNLPTRAPDEIDQVIVLETQPVH